MNDALRSLDPGQNYKNPQIEKLGEIKNNWRDSAHVLVARWISLVYKLTNFDIQKQYMDGINPNDPLHSIRQ